MWQWWRATKARVPSGELGWLRINLGEARGLLFF